MRFLPPAVALALLVPLAARAECRESETLVQGHSLEPLVKDGARLPLVAGDCVFPLAHGDLVALVSGASKVPLLKVVKAIPGDRVELVPDAGLWLIRVNGEVAKNSAGQPYRLAKRHRDMLALYVGDNPVVRPNAYLVLGDNPAGTIDSTRIGLVDRADIVARVPAKAMRGKKR